MTLKEIIEKEGIEVLQSKLQSLINNKAIITLEEKGSGLSFAVNNKTVAYMDYSEALDDDKDFYLESILNFVSERYVEKFVITVDDFSMFENKN